jgi:hypothetical protein
MESILNKTPVYQNTCGFCKSISLNSCFDTFTHKKSYFIDFEQKDGSHRRSQMFDDRQTAENVFESIENSCLTLVN